MEKSGSELALESTLRKNFENFWLLKVVEWGRIIAQNDPLATLLLKKYKRNNFDSHIMAPESSKVPKLGHFFSKQGNFFSGNRIDKKLLDFVDEEPFYYLQ
jgi:hypothetical protein